MAPRNHISTSYPRAAKIDLIRWREVDGVPQGRAIARCAERYPDLPAIHGTTWLAWTATAEYRDLRALVTGEQAERERMSDLYQAAGGDDALADVATAASYALASRAMALAPGLDDVAEIRRLMAAVADARKIAAEQTREHCEAQIAAIETDHAQEIAALHAQLADRDATLAALREQLSGAADGRGLTPESIDEIERRLRLL